MANVMKQKRLSFIRENEQMVNGAAVAKALEERFSVETPISTFVAAEPIATAVSTPVPPVDSKVAEQAPVSTSSGTPANTSKVNAKCLCIAFCLCLCLVVAGLVVGLVVFAEEEEAQPANQTLRGLQHHPLWQFLLRQRPLQLRLPSPLQLVA